MHLYIQHIYMTIHTLYMFIYECVHEPLHVMVVCVCVEVCGQEDLKTLMDKWNYKFILSQKITEVCA